MNWLFITRYEKYEEPKQIMDSKFIFYNRAFDAHV